MEKAVYTNKKNVSNLDTLAMGLIMFVLQVNSVYF